MVSIEYIVEITNLLKKDIWLSIPQEANADYIKNLAEFVRNSLTNETTIYLEESTNIGFKQNNRTATMQLVSIWKNVFSGNETAPRIKYILSTLDPAYFDSVLSYFTQDDLNEFDAFSVPVTS